MIWYLDRKQLQKRNEQLDEAQKMLGSFTLLIKHLDDTIERNTSAFGSVLEIMRKYH